MSSTLPPNCEIEWIDLDDGVFRLVFWGDDPYYSEALTAGKDEYAHDVAVSYIERMGWDKAWPNMPDNTEALLDELEILAENALVAIENNPEHFGFTWEEMAETFSELKLEDGRHGEDIDCEPYPYYNEDHWAEHEDCFVYIIEDGKLSEIELQSWDGCDWETDAVFDGPKDSDELLRYSATANCWYHCLKCNLYSIYMARTGEDPIGTVFPLKDEHNGCCTVTVTKDGFEFERKLDTVHEEVKEEIRAFLGGSLDQLRMDLAEIDAKIGVTNNETGSGVVQWLLVSNTEGEVVMRIKYEMKCLVPDQASHIKEVAMRGLEADIRRSHQYVMDKVTKGVAHD